MGVHGAKPLEAPVGFYSIFIAKYFRNLFHSHICLQIIFNSPELAQFPPVTVEEGGGGGLLQSVYPDFNGCLYQASCRGYSYNLARFGSSEPGLTFTFRKLP